MKDGSRETIQNLAIVVSLVVVTFLNHLDIEAFFRGFSDSDPVPRLADLRWQKRLGDFGVGFGAGSLVAGFVADRVRAKGLWAVLVGVWILLELSTGHLGDVFFGAAALDGVVTFVSRIGSVAGGALSIAICIFSSKELSVSDLASRSIARWSDGSPAEKHLEVDHHRRDASIFVFFSSETLICNTIGCFSLLFVACLQFWSTDYLFDRFHLELPTCLVGGAVDCIYCVGDIWLRSNKVDSTKIGYPRSRAQLVCRRCASRHMYYTALNSLYDIREFSDCACSIDGHVDRYPHCFIHKDYSRYITQYVHGH